MAISFGRITCLQLCQMIQNKHPDQVINTDCISSKVFHFKFDMHIYFSLPSYITIYNTKFKPVFLQIIMTSLPCNTCSIYTCIQISHHSTSLNRKFDQLTCWAWSWSYLKVRKGIIRAKNMHNDLSTYIQSVRSTLFCQNSFLFRNFTGI